MQSGPHKRRRIERNDHVHAFREGRTKFLHAVHDGFGRAQRVRAGRELDGHAGGSLSFVSAESGVALQADLHAGDVAQANFRTVLLHLEEDVAEFFRRLQKARRGNRHRVLLLAVGRLLRETAGRNLRVLRADRRFNVGRIERVFDELFRVEPDAHGVGSAEHLRFTDAGNARERFLHARHQEVAEVARRELAVGADEAHHHQEVGGGLFNFHAELLHDLRQRRQGGLNLVLDLHLRHVGVRAGFEGHGDTHAARGVGGRRHVEVTVQTRQVLFDHLRHGVFNRFGRGPRIGRRDGHLRRRDHRVLTHGQIEDRQEPGKHDDDGHHPCEHRSVNEKTGQHFSSLPGIRRERGSASSSSGRVPWARRSHRRARVACLQRSPFLPRRDRFRSPRPSRSC